MLSIKMSYAASSLLVAGSCPYRQTIWILDIAYAWPFFASLLWVGTNPHWLAKPVSLLLVAYRGRPTRKHAGGNSLPNPCRRINSRMCVVTNLCGLRNVRLSKTWRVHGTYSEPMANTRVKYGLLHSKQQAHIFTTIETGCAYQIKIENSKGKWDCDGLGVFK